MVFDIEMIKNVYSSMKDKVDHAKKVCKSRSPVCDPCVISAACDKRDINIPKSKLRQNLNT